MVNKTVHKDNVIWIKTKTVKSLPLDMPRKPEEANTSFSLQGEFGILNVEKISKPYFGKDI